MSRIQLSQNIINKYNIMCIICIINTYMRYTLGTYEKEFTFEPLLQNKLSKKVQNIQSFILFKIYLTSLVHDFFKRTNMYNNNIILHRVRFINDEKQEKNPPKSMKKIHKKPWKKFTKCNGENFFLNGNSEVSQKLEGNLGENDF